MNPLIIFGACAVIGGFGPWSGGHRVPVARGGQRLWGGPTGHKYPARGGGFRQSLHQAGPRVPMQQPQQQQYFGGQTVTLTNNQMRMLHRDGQVMADGILIKFMQTRLDGFGAPLNSATRRSLPSRAFGLPKQRKYPMYTRSPMSPRGDLTFSRTHAINAKGRAKWMLDEGTISDGQYNRIVGKADRLLSRHGDR